MHHLARTWVHLTRQSMSKLYDMGSSGAGCELHFLSGIHQYFIFRYDALKDTWTKNTEVELTGDTFVASAMFLDDDICSN